MARVPSPIYLDSSFANGTEKLSGQVLRRPRRSIAFGWYGGKYSHLDWLLPLLPECHHYCEPFGGSAAVLLNRNPSPVETYNDIDGEVTNFFKVLRDSRDELIENIGLTPFSREEFYVALNGRDERISDMERARRFFVRARQGQNRFGADGNLGKMGQLQEHQPGRHEWGRFSVAGQRQGTAWNC